MNDENTYYEVRDAEGNVLAVGYSRLIADAIHDGLERWNEPVTFQLWEIKNVDESRRLK